MTTHEGPREKNDKTTAPGNVSRENSQKDPKEMLGVGRYRNENRLSSSRPWRWKSPRAKAG